MRIVATLRNVKFIDCEIHYLFLSVFIYIFAGYSHKSLIKHLLHCGFKALHV